MYQIDFQSPCHIYFVGIGGISMSGLAEILKDAGFHVSGSDSKYSEVTDLLENKGITVFYGQRAENITPNLDCVVFTSAIRPDNPEYIATNELGIPSLTRAQLLGQLMKNYKMPIAVSGTHGKTTTTSMISEILLQTNQNPTLSIGGMLKSIGGNIRVGGNDIFVTEACEYTNSFLSFYPKIGIILNIEEDHLDFFKDINDIRNSFQKFAALLPVDGTLIINGAIENYEELTKELACNVLTFGLSKDCNCYASDIQYDSNGCPSFLFYTPDKKTYEITLSVPGEHNICNAVASLTLAYVLELSLLDAAKALQQFTGTNRRFEHKGEIGGVTIVDDYAHHPTEITATLNASSKLPHKTLWCVFQPHTYTRTKAFLSDFAEALSLADKVVLADIYAARETNQLGISSKDLQKEIQKLGTTCYYFPTFDEIENFLLENCINGDLLITMGAGDIVKIGENLLGK